MTVGYGYSDYFLPVYPSYSDYFPVVKSSYSEHFPAVGSSYSEHFLAAGFDFPGYFPAVVSSIPDCLQPGVPRFPGHRMAAPIHFHYPGRPGYFRQADLSHSPDRIALIRSAVFFHKICRTLPYSSSFFYLYRIYSSLSLSSF